MHPRQTAAPSIPTLTQHKMYWRYYTWTYVDLCKLAHQEEHHQWHTVSQFRAAQLLHKHRHHPQQHSTLHTRAGCSGRALRLHTHGEGQSCVIRCQFEEEYWAHAAITATFVRNKSPFRHGTQTPCELSYGRVSGM